MTIYDKKELLLDYFINAIDVRFLREILEEYRFYTNSQDDDDVRDNASYFVDTLDENALDAFVKEYISA